MGRARASTRWGGRRFEGGDRAGGLCSQERAYQVQRARDKACMAGGCECCLALAVCQRIHDIDLFFAPP